MQRPFQAVWWFFAFFFLVTPAACAIGAPGTGLDGYGVGAGDGLDEDPSTARNNDGICLMQSCEMDSHCAGCANLGVPHSFNTTCLESERRCIACDPNTREGCPEGFTCTDEGYCAKYSQCPNDFDDKSCASDVDCTACGQGALVCDTRIGQCVSCTEINTTYCTGTQRCLQAECVDACPDRCAGDSDCSHCGYEEGGRELHACYAGRCAECSPDRPCPSGERCSPSGTCEAYCGVEGHDNGTCRTDADCGNCPSGMNACIPVLNGGISRCGPSARGCVALGEQVLLPEPFDKITELCTAQQDCANVAARLNVGKILRDITGIKEIRDANLEYGMRACATVPIGGAAADTNGDGIPDNSGATQTCGVCVPCMTNGNSACQDINIDQLAGDLFGFWGALGSALILNRILGATADGQQRPHVIFMRCMDVTWGMGACRPCPRIGIDCAPTDNVVDGACLHSPHEEGEKMPINSCGCADKICHNAGYEHCCTTSWDAECVEAAGWLSTWCGDS